MRPFKNGIGYSKKTTIYSHQCFWCGSEFTGSMDKHYCSSGCRLNAWRARKRNENPTPQFGRRHYCSWGQVRFAALQRDGFRCRYCGRGHKEQAVLQVDHFLAKANGGTDDLENLVTACSECNYSKADRIVTAMPQ